MKKPNDTKRPNPTKFRPRTTLPQVMDGLNRLYQYRDGVIHKVILRSVQKKNPETGEYYLTQVADHLKRVSPRSSKIAKQVRAFTRKRKYEEANPSSDAGTVQPIVG